LGNEHLFAEGAVIDHLVALIAVVAILKYVYLFGPGEEK
jgi:hypothetical protein